MSEVQEPGTSRKLKPNRFRITSIIIAVVVSCLMLGASFIPILASDTPSRTQEGQPMQKAMIAYSQISEYSNDDGSPANVFTDTYAQNQRYVKIFPSVTVPANSDLLVKFWHASTAQAYAYQFKIGNADNGYNVSGTTKTYYFEETTGSTATAGWAQFRVPDATSFLSNGSVLVNVTHSGHFSPTIVIRVYYDNAANTGGYKFWYYNGAAWSDQSANWLPFIRIAFVAKESVDTDHSLAQLQMGANLTASTSYFSGDYWYIFSSYQTQDGISTSTATGYGWVNANYTYMPYLNFTFKDKIVMAIGDSIIAGTPYHSPNPTVYGAADRRDQSMEYFLEQKLGQTIINRGVGSDTTTLMSTRLTTDILSYYPDFVIVQGGVNDISLGTTTAALEARLLAIYNNIVATKAHVIALTILPDSNFNAAKRTQINDTNVWIKLQASSDISVVDTFEYLNDVTTTWALAASYDSGDHVHPSVAGYQKMADVIFSDAFSSIASTTTSYLIDKVTFETNPIGQSSAAIPQTVNLSYATGYQIQTLTNGTSQTLDIGRVTTSWLRITVLDGYWPNGGAPTRLCIGEVRIYGLPSGWTSGSAYLGWSNITTSQNLYGGLPYPRSALSSLSITPTTFANVTVITWNSAEMIWNATGSSLVTFTLSGLESGRMYRLYIDGVSSSLLTASESGVVSFTYSGPWSERQFEIVATSIGGSISGLVNLIFIMFAIGIVVGVVAEGTYSLRKMQMCTTQQMVKSLLNMVIYIVIGMASLGVLYSMVI